MIIFNILLGAFLGFVAFSAVMAICTLIVGSVMNYRFLYIRFLSLYIKKENGTLRFDLGGAQLNSHCEMYKKGETKNDIIPYNILPCVLCLLIFGILTAVYIFCGIDKFVLQDCIYGGLFYAAAHLIVNIKISQELLNTEKGRILLDKNLSSSNMLTGDIRPRDFDITPQTPEVKRYSSMDLASLLCEYYYYLDIGDMESALEYVAIFDKNTPRFNSFAYLPYIYEQIFYESYITKNVGIHGLFTEVEHQLCSDTSIFAKRVYAYYLYYAVNNKQQALEIANEGIKTAETYEFSGISKMEKELLEKLIEQITNEGDQH